MGTQRLVPPIVILNRAHDVVFFRRHGSVLAFYRAQLVRLWLRGRSLEMTCHRWVSFVTG
jgi:hypothetical protein